MENVLNTVVKEKKRSTLAKANNNDLNTRVDEIVSRAPSFSDKQIDTVSEALEIKGAA